jgi:hypothetical protein
MGFLKLPFLAMAMATATFGCSSDCDVVSYVDGMLVDYRDFTGCEWVIESDKLLLEPVNVYDFSLDLTDSLKVRFAYAEDDNQKSACRVGTVVRLLDIYEK